MRILVLGGYGLIGAEISKRLLTAGHTVVGLARSERRGRSIVPGAEWLEADISRLTTTRLWAPLVVGVDAVVNAAGALQTGARDDVAAVQRDAIVALIRTCEAGGPRTFVQISAPGASAGARTQFLRTKGEADAVLMESGLEWTIFRPGLVVGPQAYGGTGLVRLLAAFPLIQPHVLGAARLQTVAVDDVAQAVEAALATDLSHRVFDLVEDEAHTLTEILAAFREWLGFPAAAFSVALPRGVGYAVAKFADVSGWLGWRSPLRTTALRVLEDDIVGNPAPWREASGRPLKSLRDTLRSLPSTAQERRYARTQLVFPLLLLTLSLFWIASGGVGLWQLEAGAAVLDGTLPAGPARAAVVIGASVDVAIGAAVLIHRFVRPACLAAILVSLGYLAAATVLTPHLWSDPLGPLVKILPAMALAFAVAAMADER